jgi:hypothetical protein
VVFEPLLTITSARDYIYGEACHSGENWEEPNRPHRHSISSTEVAKTLISRINIKIIEERVIINLSAIVPPCTSLSRTVSLSFVVDNIRIIFEGEDALFLEVAIVVTFVGIACNESHLGLALHRK